MCVARVSSERNGLSALRASSAEPFESSRSTRTLGAFDRILIDPPRDGAMELVKPLATTGAPSSTLSSPATLARDAEVPRHTRAMSKPRSRQLFQYRAVESIALSARRLNGGEKKGPRGAFFERG